MVKYETDERASALRFTDDGCTGLGLGVSSGFLAAVGDNPLNTTVEAIPLGWGVHTLTLSSGTLSVRWNGVQRAAASGAWCRTGAVEFGDSTGGSVFLASTMVYDQALSTAQLQSSESALYERFIGMSQCSKS